MESIKFEIDATENDRATKILAGITGGSKEAIRNSLKLALEKIRTGTVKAITGVYDISVQNLRAGTNIRSHIYGTADTIIGQVSFAGKKIPLYRYNVSPKMPTHTEKTLQVVIDGYWKTIYESAPVSAKMKRGGSLVNSSNAFIAEMKSGHIGVFERVGSESNKIIERMGLATAQMAGNSVVSENVQKEAHEVFSKSLDEEITRILNGFR